MKRDVSQIGECTYWHNLPGFDQDAWGSSINEHANFLIDHFYKNRDNGLGSPDYNQTKGMALEILCAFANSGQEIPYEFVRLMADLMVLPREYGDDLQAFYSGNYGKRARTSHRQAYDSARWFEADQLRRSGKRPTAVQVAHHVGVSEETVRQQWRKQPDYEEFVQFVGNR